MKLFLMKLFNIKPRKYWLYHHSNCGTKFRGCDPDFCPKDYYERTGRWDWELLKGKYK